jgi:hypothetical protein
LFFHYAPAGNNRQPSYPDERDSARRTFVIAKQNNCLKINEMSNCPQGQAALSR